MIEMKGSNRRERDRGMSHMCVKGGREREVCHTCVCERKGAEYNIVPDQKLLLQNRLSDRE